MLLFPVLPYPLLVPDTALVVVGMPAGRGVVVPARKAIKFRQVIAL